MEQSTFLKNIHKEVKIAHGLDLSENDICDIDVSINGTWLYSSLIEEGCVIDISTGYVIDFEFMSEICRLCNTTKKDLGGHSAEFVIWYEGHKPVYDLNRSGSSASMEMKTVSIIWKHSSNYGFRYATLLSDGDAKTAAHLLEQHIYVKDVILKKEDA